MTTERIQPDDPRLTAYVLDELDATERAGVEAALERSPEAQATLAELRQTIGLIQNALSHEPAAALSQDQRLAIAAAAGQSTDRGQREPVVPAPANVRRPFRRRYIAVATCVSIAAALALVLAVPALVDQEQSNAHRFDQASSTSAKDRNVELAAASARKYSDADHSGTKVVSEREPWGNREELELANSSSESQRGAHSLNVANSAQPQAWPTGESQPAGLPKSRRQFQQSGIKRSGAGHGGYGLPTGPPRGTASRSDADEYGSEYGEIPSDPTYGGGGYGPSVPGNQPVAGAGDRLAGRSSQAGQPASRQSAPRSQGSQQRQGAQARESSSRGAAQASSGSQRGQPAGAGWPRVQSESERTKRALSRMEPDSPNPTTPDDPEGDGQPSDSSRFAFEARGASPNSTTESESLGEVLDVNARLAPKTFNLGTEAYNPIIENDFITPTGQSALSTFSIDVDTASYSNVRRFLTHGQFPPSDAVRIEELLNYFRYDYPQPEGNSPFSVTTEVGVCPWNPDHRLARIGLKGREIAKDQRPPSNLVFLVDVSGSMRDANKLPLVQQGLEMLVGEMTEDDRVAIVTYAGEAGVKLPSTSGDRRDDILSVIRGLSAGGSTNGEAGIHLAYTEAIRHSIDDGTNRVILCTDGDFNVGVSDDNELVRLIQDKARQSRIFLSIFGFGMGNLKDAKLEQLANKGNGQYAYVDSPREARKVFVEEMAGSLYTIAKDVKIQVEFNPARVGAYRLIGYENRALAARDFSDDTKDAGEIGAGHTVTALYELIPADKLPPADGEPLKYQPRPADEPAAEANADASPESFTVKLRFKQPDEDHSTLVEFPVADHSDRSASPSRDFDWAASVAAFGLILRNSQHKGQADFELVRELALGGRGSDESGLRREFIDLIYKAKILQARQAGQPVPAPEALPDDEARTKATAGGKYRKLLKRLHVPQDFQPYGAFNDYGYWGGTSYAGENDLPQGHWVYVYPHWYIWGEEHSPSLTSPPPSTPVPDSPAPR